MSLPSDNNTANKFKFYMQELRDKPSTAQPQGITFADLHKLKSRTENLIKLIENLEKNPRFALPPDETRAKERPNVLAMSQLQEVVHVMDEQMDEHLNSESAFKPK